MIDAAFTTAVGYIVNPSIAGAATGFITWLTPGTHSSPKDKYTKMLITISSIGICALIQFGLQYLSSDNFSETVDSGKNYLGWFSFALLYGCATWLTSKGKINKATTLAHPIATMFITLMAPKKITSQLALFFARQTSEFGTNRCLQVGKKKAAKACRLVTHLIDPILAYTTLKGSSFPAWAGLGLLFLDPKSSWNMISSFLVFQTPGWFANTLFPLIDRPLPAPNWFSNGVFPFAEQLADYSHFFLLFFTAYRCINLLRKDAPETSSFPRSKPSQTQQLPGPQVV